MRPGLVREERDLPVPGRGGPPPAEPGVRPGLTGAAGSGRWPPSAPTPASRAGGSTSGQRHDGVCAQALLERIRVRRLGVGRPRCRPDHVIADKAYSSRGFRAYLRKRGIGHTIPEKIDQQRHRRNRGRRGGRPPTFDRETYRRRNTVERCFNQLKHFRGIATRFDKTAASYEAAVSLASFLLWARSV
ncbi:transposase [Streptomyces bauhiniae]|uniref:transposase n=1 Tax=Streptomyces bauhiniae TaxID=2340725 RepID=UPI0037F73D95